MPGSFLRSFNAFKRMPSAMLASKADVLRDRHSHVRSPLAWACGAEMCKEPLRTYSREDVAEQVTPQMRGDFLTLLNSATSRLYTSFFSNT